MTDIKTIITNLLELYTKHLTIIKERNFPLISGKSLKHCLLEYLKDKYLENGVCHAYQWNFGEGICTLPFVVRNGAFVLNMYWCETPHQIYFKNIPYEKFVMRVVISFEQRINILNKELSAHEREIAMNWWNNLAALQKTQICDTNTELVGSIRRWETLTGREIQMLYNKLQK